MSKRKRDKHRKRRQKASQSRRLGSEATPSEGQEPEVRSMFASLGRKTRFVDGTGPKVSDRLLRLATPYERYAETDEAARMVIDTAAIAWNIAVLPKDRHADEIESALEHLRAPDAETLATGREILTAMVKRKLKLFPTDARVIVSHTLTTTREGFNLRCVSLPVPPQS